MNAETSLRPTIYMVYWRFLKELLKMKVVDFCVILPCFAKLGFQYSHATFTNCVYSFLIASLYLKLCSSYIVLVKRAYHKLSLKIHPDRVDKEHKDDATRRFQSLGKIYSILSDKAKRAVYDDTGL